MSILRSLALHLGLLAAAVTLALFAWLRDETPDLEAKRTVVVWNGKSDDVTSVTWESDKLKVSLSAQKDANGRYFITQVQQEVAHVKPQTEADAGASGKTVTERKREDTRFVSATAAEKLLEQLAPLRALRAIGQVEEARNEEFGFKESTGTLRVTIGGTVHSLLFGGNAPGGGDAYARDLGSGEVYALPAEIGRTLMYASSRLLERELHAWKDEEANRVVLSSGERSRELTRVAGKSDAWADVASPTTQNETAGNWLTKLGRLRVMSHVEKTGVLPVIVKVRYFDGRRPLGELELARLPGDDKTAEYVVRTEHTRWFAKVFRTNAEEIEQDLGAVLR